MRDQDIARLQEVYASIYTSQENEEQLDENIRDAAAGALKTGAEFMKTNPVGKVISGALKPSGKGRKTPTKTSRGYRPEEVETDFFDYILEHLVSEGYADTNKAALAIMANMSEEWRQSIVESLDPDSPGNTHSLGDLYKAQEKWFKDNPHLDRKTGKPKKGGSGASSQAKDA